MLSVGDTGHVESSINKENFNMPRIANAQHTSIPIYFIIKY